MDDAQQSSSTRHMISAMLPNTRTRTANIFCGILLGASSIHAIPLRVGASWKWEVVDYGARTSRIVEASVADSVATDTGTIWNIIGPDTLKRFQILQTERGEQGWLLGDGELPWEPSPFDSGRTKRFEPWGLQAWRSSSFRVPFVSGTASSLKGSAGTALGSNVEVTAPSCIWSDSLGVERFRFRNVDWRLISFDGRPVNTVNDTLFIPDSGKVFEWDYLEVNTSSGHAGGLNFSSADTSKLRLRWEILGWARDSAEWSIVMMRVGTTSKSSASDTIYDLRINRVTKQRVPSDPLGGESPDVAWWKDWTESDGPQSATRFNEESDYGYMSRTSTSSNMSISKGERVLASYAWEHFSSAPYIGSSSAKRVYTRVVPGVPQGVVRKASRHGNGLTMSNLVTTFPDLEVRWVDVKGRSGSFRANEFGKVKAEAGKTPIHMFAILPDGTRWSATTMEFAVR